MVGVKFKRKEAKTLRFTVRSGGGIVDLTTATLQFNVKKHKSETTAVISKADAVFDKTLALSGIVTVELSMTDLDQTPGDYVGELKTTFSASNIDKSADIPIEIQKAVTD